MTSLDTLLAGVEEAVGQAKREAARQVAAAKTEASYWQEQFERERNLRQQLEVQPPAAPPRGTDGTELPEGQAGSPAAEVAREASAAGLAGDLETSLSLRSAVRRAAGGAVSRRHTTPALRSSGRSALGAPELYDQLSSTASRLEAMRQELERDLAARAGASAAGPAGGADSSAPYEDGTLTLSRLSSMLQACSFLREASAAACSRRDSQELGQAEGGGGLGGEQEVSLHDDGGAGVGATAAAAVSVALAQSWAAAAGARQASFRHAAAAEGAVRPGKARFKLVAAVPRSYRQRQRWREKQLAGAASRTSLTDAEGGANGSLAQQQQPQGLQGLPGTPGGAPRKLAPYESTSALVNLAEAEPNSMDDDQEATWRASGQHLKLQWLSPPATVLVVYKPVPKVFSSCVKAVGWLLQRGLVVYVEPDVHAELAAAVSQHLESSSSSGSREGLATCSSTPRIASGIHMSRDSMGGGDNTASVDSLVVGSFDSVVGSMDSHAGVAAFAATGGGFLGATSGSGGGGVNGSSSGNGSGISRPVLPAADVDLARQLLTWQAPACGCPPAVPCSVGHQLDLIITLGGDGTVLWTCGLFAAGPVPPLVPFSMGSLGFMTPFSIDNMDSVLSRATGLGQGVPLMLRHRLQCRIIRSDASSLDLNLSASAASGGGANGGGNGSAECLEEFVVLNEVVIDRGMKAQLCNLQCYADQNHVTVVQGDGLIVATPTGSTAYNLAAGGSMIHPAVPCFLFTPICPHSLASRPLVFPEHVTLRVKVPLDSRSGAYCSFDGRSRQELRPGDSVLISMSQWPAPMVCNLDASHDWFLSMREGLSWNVRKQQAGKGQ